MYDICYMHAHNSWIQLLTYTTKCIVVVCDIVYSVYTRHYLPTYLHTNLPRALLTSTMLVVYTT